MKTVKRAQNMTHRLIYKHCLEEQGNDRSALAKDKKGAIDESKMPTVEDC